VIRELAKINSRTSIQCSRSSEVAEMGNSMSQGKLDTSTVVEKNNQHHLPSKQKHGHEGNNSLNVLRNNSKKKEIKKMEKTFDVDDLRKTFEAKLKEQEPSKSVIVTQKAIGPFEIVKTLGTGTFGRVMLVKISESECDTPVDTHNIHNGYKYFSIKAMKKRQLMKLKQLDHIMNEKRLQSSFTFPFLIECKNSFKDNSNVFLQMEYMPGGEMFTHLRKARRFNENLSKFYASQVVLGFEYLHSLSILYRDLKPENILMSTDGYIKIADFGFAKQVKSRTWTMCGTPEYLAPEIVLNKGYNSSVDWWALGVLIFEMCAGCPPFYDSTPMRIYEKILQNRVKFLPFFSNSLKDLLKKLLECDVTARIGNLATGVDEIKTHPWFENHVNWSEVYNKKIKSIYSINITDPESTINFDEYDEEELSSCDECLYQEDFKFF